MNRTLLVAVCFILLAAVAGAITITTPVIKTIQGKTVIPGEMNFVTSKTFTIAGVSQTYRVVRVWLYMNGECIKNNILPNLRGNWSTSVTIPGDGAYSFQVLASGVREPFLSAISKVATVTLDLMPPTISFNIHAGDYVSLKPYIAGYENLLRADVVDPVVAGATSSGLNFDSVNFYMKDNTAAGKPVIPGDVTTDYDEFLWWTPQGGDWSPAEVNRHQYYLSCYIEDKAGNQGSSTYQYYIDSTNPPPVITHVYDPFHYLGSDSYTGIGEVDNPPDGQGWVKYYPHMTLFQNPTKAKGYVASWSIPVNTGFDTYEIRSCARQWGTWLATPNTTNGSWQLDYNRRCPIGTHVMNIDSMDSALLHTCDAGREGRAKLELIYEYGVPRRPTQMIFASGTYKFKTGSYYIKEVGDTICPDIIVKVWPLATDQTAIIDYGWGGTSGFSPRLAQQVISSGLVYLDTPGQYDKGEIFQDLNRDSYRQSNEPYFDNSPGQYDLGEKFQDLNGNTVRDPDEPYEDQPARGTSVSDGVTATLTNFLNLGMHANRRTCIRAFSTNYLGVSPCRGAIRFCLNNDYPPNVADAYCQPLPRIVPRKSVYKPTYIYFKAYTYSPGVSGCCGAYSLDYNKSWIRVVNNMDQEIIPPQKAWRAIYRQTTHQAEINCASVNFPDGTYRVEATLEDKFGHKVVDTPTSTVFKIDNVPPNTTDEQPPPGGLSNSFPSFNARIVDPALSSDQSEGTGVELNPFKDQLWAYKRLTVDFTPVTTGFTQTMPISDPINGKAVNEYEIAFIPGMQAINEEVLEIWEKEAGQFTQTVIPSASVILDKNGSPTANKLTVKRTDAQFEAGKTYVLVYQVPCFTSNDGVDRVGAVPVNPITADGEYFVKIKTLDRAGNQGSIILNYSRCKVPYGTFSITPSKSLAIAGLDPPDFVTFTTSQITCRDGSTVVDGQEMSFAKNGPGYPRPPDTNGLMDDGIQTPMGIPSDPPDNGRCQIDFVMSDSTAGTLYIAGFIGKASGTSPTVTVNRVNAFSISPTTVNLLITPDNPNPVASLTCANLKDTSLTLNVPDGSLATWTYSTDFDPKAANLSHFGMSYFSANNCVNNNLNDTGWHTNSAVAGAWIKINLISGTTPFAMPYTKVRLNAQGGLYKGIYNVEYSDDDSVWTTVVEGLAPTGFGWVETFWDDVGPHRYWRLRLMNTPGTGGTIREMEWQGNGATITTDEDPAAPGVQTKVASGATSVDISAGTKLVATVNMSIGGMTSPNCTVTFLDRHPPPPPAWILPSVTYSTGTCSLTWPYTIDVGGAGTKDFRLESSKNGAAFGFVATITMPATLKYDFSSIAEGLWTYRVAARDNDLNISSFTVATKTVIVDKTGPTAVACTDNGPGNNDPDYRFSADTNVYFYWNATDTLSGVTDVNIQIATAANFLAPIFDGWIGNVDQYCYTDGQHKATYYARVRAKDRCGNIGGWGASSDGLMVFSKEAMRPPNIPTIVSIASTPVVFGQNIYTNETANLEITGQCEAENLIEIWMDGAYLDSCLGTASGTYVGSITMTLGTHQVTVRAQNLFGNSDFSATATVIIEQTPPTLRMKVLAKGRMPFDDRTYMSNDSVVCEMSLESIDMIASDTGGSGVDMTTASMTITDIDNAGNPIAVSLPYNNPVLGRAMIISADTARFFPFLGAPYDDFLQDKHRYRVRCMVSDAAGNTSAITRDFVVDNTKPGLAAGTPPTSPPNSPINKLYVYDLDVYPWPAMPPAAAIVPLTWNAASAAYMVDPSFVDASLVSDEYSPRAILFNSIGLYGNVHVGEALNPAAQAGKDSFACKVEACWGFFSAINTGVDGLGNANTFRFPCQTVINGMLTQKLVVSDTAENRDYFDMILNVRSPLLRPDPPSAIQFQKVNNPSTVYTVYGWDALFPMAGIDIENREVFITDNDFGIVASIAVSVMGVSQTVEIVATSGSVIANAVVAPGESHAAITLNQALLPGKLEFQVRTVANGTRSLTMPRLQKNWYYTWILNDTMSPAIFDIFPVANLFNRLSGADALPFPTDFNVRGKDLASDTIRSYLKVAASSAALKDVNGTVVPGALIREYDVGNAFYGFAYTVASTPATDGTYYYTVQLEDAASPGPHTAAASYPFILDSIPPAPSKLEPADGAKVYAIDAFNAFIADPNLPDGTPGAGPNMNTARSQVIPYKLLARGAPVSDTVFSCPVLGQDATATNHIDEPLTVGSPVVLCELTAASQPTDVFRSGTVTANGEDVLTVSSSGMDPAKSYAVMMPMPFFTTNDGELMTSAVTSQPITKGGYYVAYVYPLDKALNRGTLVTASSLYEAAIGEFYIYPQRTSLYAGLIPPHVATFTSSPIMTTEGLPIPGGIDVTLKTSKGSFVPGDSNNRPRDGHQVKSNADGTITFGLAATGNTTGNANVTAKLGLAGASDQSVTLIPLPVFQVTPSTTMIEITKDTPSPIITFTTSDIGNPGDLVPDGTLITASTTYGTLGPADADASLFAHQVPVVNGKASFTLTASLMGSAMVAIQAGDVTLDKTVSFIDRYPPSAPGALTFDQTLNNTGDFVVFCGLSTDYGGAGLNLYVLESSAFSGSTWGAWKVLTTSKAPVRSFYLNGLDEGRYKFRVCATDKSGNKGDYGNESGVIIVDKTKPTGSMVINNGAAFATSRSVILNMSANDENGVKSYRVSNDGSSWSTWFDYETTKAWLLNAGDGNKIVYVQFKDNAENVSITYTDGIALDSSGPSGTFSTSKTYTTTRNIDLLFTATDVNGVSSIVFSRQGPDGLLASQSSAFDPIMPHTLPPQNGTYVFYAQFFDGLGNSSEVLTTTVYFDGTPPPAPTMLAEPVYASGTVNTVSCTTVVDNISPTVLYRFQCGLDADFLNSVYSEWTEYPFWEFGGLVHKKKYYYRVRAQDGSLNESADSGSVFSTQDTQAPTGFYSIADTNADPDTKISRDQTVSFIGTNILDDCSGVKSAYVEVARDKDYTDVVWSSGWFSTTNGAVSCTPNVTNGTYLRARAQFEDVAGNRTDWKAIGANASIAIDLDVPIATGVTDWIGNTDPDHFCSADNKITFSFGGSTDPGFVPKNMYNQTYTLASVTLQLEIDDNQSFSSPTVAETVSLSGTTTSHQFTGLPEGHYRARIQVGDKAGWASSWGAYSDGIWIDKTAPGKPVVTDDGEYSGIPTVLHATWVAVDAGSGINRYEVCVGTTQDGTDVVPWTDVGTSTERSFTDLTLALDGETLYYFSVRATDRVGNVSKVGYSDGIKAGDPSPPDPVTVTDDGEFTPSATTLHAVWTQSFDAQSGINRYEYAIGTASGTTNVLAATSVGVNLEFTNSALTLIDGTTYFIHVRAVNGGNTPAPWSVADGITCDLSPPPVPVMNPEPEYSSGTSNIVSCPAVIDATSHGERYEFQRATDAGFSAGVVSSGWLADPVFSFDGMAHETKYWFRVRSKDAVENVSAWSATVFSTQDSNPPTGSYIVDPASNLDPGVLWSRDTTAAFIANNLTDDLSGVQDVNVQIAQVSDFGTTLTSEWLGNKTGAVARTLPVSNGAYLWARAQFKDVAGNISPWYTTAVPIAIDLNAPVPAATTDWVGNTDPNHQVSSDTNIMFTFSGSTDAQFVPKNIYNVDGTLESIQIVVEVSEQPTFSSTAIATDVVLAGTATGYYYSGCVDNRYYRARIKATDHAGWSTWGAYSDGIYIDNSAPWPIAGRAFFINEGQLTTASSGVKLCVTLMDWSGIASISVMSNGRPGIWTTWNYNDTTVFRSESAPQPEGVHHATIYPVPISFPVANSGGFGLWTVTLRARDIYGHMSTFTEEIQYIDILSSTPIGRRDEPPDAFGERKYPIDTYDEYKGQNKYGVPGSNTGRIMRIGQ
ncbi:Ig-like domain repeat protein [Candidatus Ozemobacteraceae bacterium]|nr:Ig-like domain repeat protein [Candidatus Ozemobacteraceae bacterium]